MITRLQNALLGQLVGGEDARTELPGPFSLLSRSMAPVFSPLEDTFKYFMPTDVETTDKAYVLSMDVPGFSK